MNFKEFEAEYTYDYQLDVINIEVKQEYIHNKSIELEFGVFLDFDEDYIPVNLEIVSASKVMGVEKDCLINPKGNVNIVIRGNTIDVEVIFNFKKNNESLQLITLNDCGFPNSQTSFALV
ncbi:MAG: hypothetical protein IJF83_09335 [Methanobrevibacter sp.]|nr:hypothetical protein [Methanobrevibacter sp.]